MNTAEGSKIHLFYIQKVFCPYAFGILIERPIISISYQTEENDLYLLFVHRVPEGVGEK